jgi:hypothetical protein
VKGSQAQTESHKEMLTNLHPLSSWKLPERLH